MTTYSVRCRKYNCRYRRVTKVHPDDYKKPPKCPKCGSKKGWRIEGRDYNKRNLCHCNGVDSVATGSRGHFPHKTTHPYCDNNPLGFYNQMKQRGVADYDIPWEYLRHRELEDCHDYPFET